MKTKASQSTSSPSASRRSLPTVASPPAPATIGAAAVTALRIKSVLVPIDFSAASKKALRYALPFARQFGAKLTLLHVVEPVAAPDFANSFPLLMESDKIAAACKAQLELLIKEEGIDSGLVEQPVVGQGRSFDVIANTARNLQTDLIIISTHGYTGLKHALLGSTTERVVRHAPCPVLVVRENEHEFVVADATVV